MPRRAQWAAPVLAKGGGLMDLVNGDCTFQAKFDKVAFSENQKITGTFKPPSGRQFVVLLLGTAELGASDFDIDAALNDLGYARKVSPVADRLLTAGIDNGGSCE